MNDCACRRVRPLPRGERRYNTGTQATQTDTRAASWPRFVRE